MTDKEKMKINYISVISMILVFTIFAINPPDAVQWVVQFGLGGLGVTFAAPVLGGLFWKKGTKQAAVFSSLGAAITYVFCYYNVHIAGINAVVWGLLAGGILYFVIGNLTCKDGLDEDIIKNCF